MQVGYWKHCASSQKRLGSKGSALADKQRRADSRRLGHVERLGGRASQEQ